MDMYKLLDKQYIISTLLLLPLSLSAHSQATPQEGHINSETALHTAINHVPMPQLSFFRTPLSYLKSTWQYQSCL